MTDQTGVPSPPTVRVRIPADVRYLQLTRVAVASMVADLDPDLDDLDDLRVAVNELVGLLVESTDGTDEIELALVLDDQTISVTGTTATALDVPAPDELTRRILASTVDRYEIGDGRFAMHKQFGRG